MTNDRDSLIPPSPRVYLNVRVDEFSLLYSQNISNVKVLEQIRAELRYRVAKRASENKPANISAQKLLDEIIACIGLILSGKPKSNGDTQMLDV
jgi:hypothetical protein